jgi:hypothetical protein
VGNPCYSIPFSPKIDAGCRKEVGSGREITSLAGNGRQNHEFHYKIIEVVYFRIVLVLMKTHAGQT